jgi:hypothetical protein
VSPGERWVTPAQNRQYGEVYEALERAQRGGGASAGRGAGGEPHLHFHSVVPYTREQALEVSRIAVKGLEQQGIRPRTVGAVA